MNGEPPAKTKNQHQGKTTYMKWKAEYPLPGFPCSSQETLQGGHRGFGLGNAFPVELLWGILLRFSCMRSPGGPCSACPALFLPKSLCFGA